MPKNLSQPATVVALPLWRVCAVATACASLLTLSCEKAPDKKAKAEKSNDSAEPQESSKDNNLNSVFDRMEPGSVVKDLLIPRYDEQKNPSSVLRALRVVIESETMVRAEKLSLHLLSSKKQKKLINSFFEIEEGHYNLTTGMLRSDSSVTAVAENFQLSSQGLITKVDKNDWETAQFSAYFLPPVSGFLNPKPSQSIAMKTRTALAAALMSSLAAQSALAEEKPAIFRMDPRTEEAEKNLQEFAKQHQIKISPIELPPLPLDTTKPVAPAETMPEFRPTADAVGFTCKGGVFLDGKSSVLTLMKQITVRDPLYAMTINGEVKVFFEEKKQDPQASATEKKELTKGLGDLKSITGTGGVAFEATDDKGVKNFASGDQVSYDAADQVVTLRGRKLIFQQGNANRFESDNPDAWLKYNKLTKDFSMSDGWNARIVMPPQ